MIRETWANRANVKNTSRADLKRDGVSHGDGAWPLRSRSARSVLRRGDTRAEMDSVALKTMAYQLSNHLSTKLRASNSMLLTKHHIRKFEVKLPEREERLLARGFKFILLAIGSFSFAVVLGLKERIPSVIELINMSIGGSWAISVILACFFFLVSIGSKVLEVLGLMKQKQLLQPTPSRLVYKGDCLVGGQFAFYFTALAFCLTLTSGITNPSFVLMGAFGLIFTFMTLCFVLFSDINKATIFDADSQTATVIQTTLLGKRTQIIPFRRIVDVDVQSTPVDTESEDDNEITLVHHLALITDLKETIDIAGHATSDEKVARLQQEDAKKIRSFLGL